MARLANNYEAEWLDDEKFKPIQYGRQAQENRLIEQSMEDIFVGALFLWTGVGALVFLKGIIELIDELK